MVTLSRRLNGSIESRGGNWKVYVPTVAFGKLLPIGEPSIYIYHRSTNLRGDIQPELRVSCNPRRT